MGGPEIPARLLTPNMSLVIFIFVLGWCGMVGWWALNET
jgi:hypothetical protein